jgi:ATP-dependent RNA helicase SUPV3L1/SUV3
MRAWCCVMMLQVREYGRLTPLAVSDSPLGDYSKVQAGDCVVAFSKQDIFAIKKEIEANTPHRCCVVYGQLPPETRSLQVITRPHPDQHPGS